MLRVVTTSNLEIVRHLGAESFTRIGVEHSTVTSAKSLLELVRGESPQLAVIDAALEGDDGFDGFALCRQLKDDEATRRVPVILVLRPEVTGADLDRVTESGCDDVVAVPLHHDEFYQHVALLTGLPVRRHQRVDVTLQIEVPEGEAITGSVDNLSTSGAGVRLKTPLKSGQEVGVRLVYRGAQYPGIQARVAWSRVTSQGQHLVGLQFIDVPSRSAVLLETLCAYDVQPALDGGVVVALQGDFTEVTDLSGLTARLANEQRIELDAHGVRYISSQGVKAWCNFIQSIAGKDYTFRRCSMAFASQIAMVPMSLGTGTVLSLEAPYYCEGCDRDEVRLLETRVISVEGGDVRPPVFRCSRCGGDLALDDVPQRYFAFLRPQE